MISQAKKILLLLGVLAIVTFFIIATFFNLSFESKINSAQFVPSNDREIIQANLADSKDEIIFEQIEDDLRLIDEDYDFSTDLDENSFVLPDVDDELAEEID